MNIICIGDVVGRPGREILAKALPGLRERHQADLVIVNGENAAGGCGILSKHAKEIFNAGADVITLGDHVWDKPETQPLLNEQNNMIRPANFPEGAPGKGYTIAVTAAGKKVAVINLLGRTFMRYNVSCPFLAFDTIYDQVKGQADAVVLDMHAETTSEKVAMGHYVDGRASVVFGTHTHIQTADDKVLAQGTAYITDLGMTGPYDSVIGQVKEKIIKRFLTSMPQKFEVAVNDPMVCGIAVSIDEQTGKAKTISRIQQKD